MTNSKVDNALIWFNAIEDSTRVIADLEEILERELINQRIAGSFDIANPEISARCLEAYANRMQAYFTILEFELAMADANHLLTFDPQHGLALKIKAAIEKSYFISTRSYTGLPLEGTEMEIIQDESTEDSIEIEVIQEEGTVDSIEVEVFQEEGINISENTFDFNMMGECKTLFSFNDSENISNAFDFNISKEINEFNLKGAEKAPELVNKRQYPFEIMEFSVKKPCYENNLANAADYPQNYFSKTPIFVTPQQQHYPNLQAHIDFLQQNQLGINELKVFLVEYIKQREMPRISPSWPNNYKIEDRKTLFNLAKNNDFDGVKQQLNTMIKNTAKSEYLVELVKSIFLMAVASNYRQMAIFFGLPKIRLLTQIPTYDEADLILNSEIYICKDEENKQFTVGFRDSDGPIIEQTIYFGWNHTLTGHLINTPFANQLMQDNFKLKKLIDYIKENGAVLPFHVFPPNSQSVIEKAISSVLGNTVIDIALLEDLMEYSSRYNDYSSFGVWSNEPNNRYSNFVCFLLIWSIKNNWLDLVVLLTTPPFKYELFQNDFFATEAIKTAMCNKNLAITDYLFKHLGFTDYQCKELFFHAYSKSNQELLSYFLNCYENGQLVYDCISSNGNRLIWEQMSDIQNQFLLTLLHRHIITDPVEYANYYLDRLLSNYMSWEVIKWFSAHPEVNADFDKPYPDNVIAFAINKQHVGFLTCIVEQRITIPKKYLDQLLSAHNIKVDFLYLLLNAYYFSKYPQSEMPNDQIIEVVKSNVIVNLSKEIAELSTDILLDENESLEKKALNKLMDLDLSCPTLLFNQLIEAPSDAILQQVSNYASKLSPYAIQFNKLQDKPHAIDVAQKLIKTPAVFNKQTPILWLNKIFCSSLDCYELRLEIGIRATYGEFLKIWLLKMALDGETEVPLDIWRYIGSMALQENTHLVETTINVCDVLYAQDPRVVNGSTMQLHRHDEETMDLVFSNGKGGQLPPKNVLLKDIGLTYSFFNTVPRSLNVIMEISAASRQKIADVVENHGGKVPVIRTAGGTQPK